MSELSQEEVSTQCTPFPIVVFDIASVSPHYVVTYSFRFALSPLSLSLSLLLSLPETRRTRERDRAPFLPPPRGRACSSLTRGSNEGEERPRRATRTEQVAKRWLTPLCGIAPRHLHNATN